MKTKFWANAHDGIQGVNPVDGDPAFLPDGFHLGPGSAAINAGAPTAVATDIDDEPRPDCVFWDIGADEVQGVPCRRNYLPTVLRN
jgi:hypothetical protein